MHDRKALDFVRHTLGRMPEAAVTLFHAYPPPPELETRQSPVLDKMKANVSYLSQKVSERQRELEQAAQTLTAGGLAADRISALCVPKKKEIASDIIDMVIQGGYQMVVLNRRSGSVTRFFTGSVYQKVINALKNKTVCVVS